MVEQDVLEALDGIQWLGSGEEVARRFGRSQPTISRYCRKALQVFELEIEHRNGVWDLIGDQRFLRMERQIHQRARQLGLRPMRLEATSWGAPPLCQQLPPDWILGAPGSVTVRRSIQLLRDRVIDAWVAGLPDLPTQVQPELTAIELTRMPVFFTCAPGHPLLQLERIGLEDIAAYPTLALPEGCDPQLERLLRQMQLGNDCGRSSRDRWQGGTEAELVVGYGTPLSLQASGGRLCRLPLQLPFTAGDALVMHSDVVADPRMDVLLSWLRTRIEELALLHPEIEVLL